MWRFPYPVEMNSECNKLGNFEFCNSYNLSNFFFPNSSNTENISFSVIIDYMYGKKSLSFLHSDFENDVEITVMMKLTPDACRLRGMPTFGLIRQCDDYMLQYQ